MINYNGFSACYVHEELEIDPLYEDYLDCENVPEWDIDLFRPNIITLNRYSRLDKIVTLKGYLFYCLDDVREGTLKVAASRLFGFYSRVKKYIPYNVCGFRVHEWIRVPQVYQVTHFIPVVDSEGRIHYQEEWKDYAIIIAPLSIFPAWVNYSEF